MKTNRRSFIKQITGFVAGVVAAFVPKAMGSKRSGTRRATKEEIAELKKSIPSNMRPVTDEDRENYCRAHIFTRECAFRRETGKRCMIDSWKETPVRQLDNGKWQHVVVGDNGNDKPTAVYLNGKRIS